MSLRSMTGFARIRKSIPEGEIVLSIKGVNHRALDIHFHMPSELDRFENALRAAIKERVARGHVQFHLAFTSFDSSDCGSLNRHMLKAYLDAFQQAVEQSGLPATPDLNTAFRIPGMFQVASESELDSTLEPALVGAAAEALGAYNEFREREGAAIASEMRERGAAICDMAAKMEKIRAKATSAFQKRLKERLADLLRAAAIEPQRLAQEAAILADRSDISEELVRLKTHAAQLIDLLNSDGEVGKKIDFLLQEMNRETNTILSKTGGLGDLGLTITDIALAAKAEIDKIREQSLNIE